MGRQETTWRTETSY
ncbi:BnaCnng12770D [Brassica napus]|uniref:BnaCnng12770D protein n=1 Tax=Brassica napus TaxID=3708 RepID=A0A078I8S6_BRANA|nr:BnaCnng12770D [Brassica napus]